MQVIGIRTFSQSNILLPLSQRLILFQHDAECNATECPPQIHKTYDHMFETPFDAEELDGLMNVTYTCAGSRGRRSSKFVISNHFASNSLGLADEEIAEFANMEINVQSRLDSCRQMLNREINFLVVDFWSIGDVLSVVQKTNQLLAATDFPSASPSVSAMPSEVGATKSPTNVPSSSPTANPTMVPTEAASSMTVPEDNASTAVPTTTLEPTLAPTLEASVAGSAESPSTQDSGAISNSSLRFTSNRAAGESGEQANQTQNVFD